VQPSLRYILVLCVSLLWSAPLLRAQERRILNASRSAEKITIDGKLNEPAWQHAEKASGFIQYGPLPGEPSYQKTEVSIIYDNDAVYIGAMLYDTRPDSIYKQLSSRDDDGGNTDEFGVIFDTYNDHQNATQFAVTAAGVQVDAILKFDGGNGAWNAAWYSKVVITDKGWCVEMKIPYSAIRFPKKDTQVWGVNFFRTVRRYKERAYWSTVLPTVPNALNQEGVLKGIENIESPVRLSLLPYISAYAQNYAGTTDNTINGGMDIKYGINESFTLDMTLVPDFGQTIFDNRVLNLSPIEVRYDERRYFFTEGLDLFNKNDLFYSRRVGGTPINAGSPVGMLATDTIIKNPATTKLYNATKISGRTRHNLGIGFFNAVAEATYASVKDSAGNTRRLQTGPLTNYNVLVLDQALKNNSYISLINTNVYRQEHSYNADVTALLFKFANRANSYSISGSGDVSQLYNAAKPDLGYRYYINVGKISGNYTGSITARTISDHFNPNDLGYLDRNNLSAYQIDQYYNIYKPVGHIVNAYNHFGIDCYRVFNPDVFQQADIFGSHNLTFRNYLTVGFYWTLQPFNNYDYNEPRTFGRYVRIPKNYMAGGFYSSDYRRKFALDLQFTERGYSERSRNIISWSVSPRYRFNDKFSMIYNVSGQFDKDDVGYVDRINDTIYFGVRDVNIVTNTLDAAYIFNNKMSLKFDARHYWAQPVYSQYHTLKNDGTLGSTNYNKDHDINFNSFNIYTSFVWQFLPGSEMSVVYQNSIYSSGANIINNYFDDLSYTFRSQESNSLSVKIIYYLDYAMLKNAMKKSS
jgi:Domain of unknown function (DUF5916)/Carbohydrate family 9 binding domain-like